MFGIGGWEFLVILAVALVVLGPQRLPAAARAIGKVAQQLRKATFDLRRSIELDPQMEDLPRTLDDLGRPAARPYASRGDRPPPRPDQDFGAPPVPDGGAVEVSSTKKVQGVAQDDEPPSPQPPVSDGASAPPPSGGDESKDERGEERS